MKIGSIQFLRAVAILLIVYAQSIDLARQVGPSYQQSFHYLGRIGYIGIDLFFVICGFVIAYTARSYTGARDGLQFLRRRFIRINPLFYIASILYFGVQWLQVWATNNPNSFLLRLNIVPGFVDSLWIVPTTGRLSQYKPYMLSIGWSLAFVWLFYLLYSLTIFTRIRKKVIVLTTIIVLLALAGYVTKPTDLRLAFASNAILLEFLLGVLICQLYLWAGKLPRILPIILLLTGVAGYAGLVFYNYGNISYYQTILNGTLSLQRFLLWGLPSGCLVAGCVLLEKNGQLDRLWNNKVIQLVGNAAYSIFLVHSIIFTLLGTLYHNLNTLLLPDLSIFVQLIIVVAIGIAVYRYLEKPFLRWLRTLSRRPAAAQQNVLQPKTA